MAVLSGYLSTPPGGEGRRDGYISADLDVQGLGNFSPFVSAGQGSSIGAAPPARYLAPGLGRTVNGYIPRCYTDDFYYRTHISPKALDLGNVINATVFEYVVWNADFVPRNLAAVASLNLDGIEVTGQSAPYSLPGTGHLLYTLTVPTGGQPTVDATISYDFDGTNDVSIHITGTRIVLWPFQYGVDTTETLEWKTQVLKSYNGNEQRVRLRKACRQFISSAYPIRADEKAIAENMIYGWRARRFAVPLWSEAQQSSAIALDALVITGIDTTKVDIRDNSLITIWESSSKCESATVVSHTASTITVKKPIGNSYSSPWVMPTRIGRAVDNFSKKTNGHEARIDAQYQFLDNIDLGAGSAPTQYLGYDVVTDRALLAGTIIQDDYIQRVDVVDYGGAISTYAPWTDTHIRRPFRFVVQGLPSIWTFRQWLHRRAGKLRPFWWPTFENNIRLKSTGSIIDTIVIESDGYKNYSSSRDHIAILKKDGSWLFRQIISSTASGADTSLALDSVINIDAGTILNICFIGLRRFDTDTVELDWRGNRTVVSSIPTLEIAP